MTKYAARWTGLLLLLLGLAGCGADDVRAADVAPGDTRSADAAGDAAGPHDAAPDAAPDAARTDAAGPPDVPAVADVPAAPEVAAPDAISETLAPDVPTPPPARPFSEGPYGTGFRESAGPFTVATLDGPLDFRALWTGRDTFLFLQFSDDPRQPAELLDFLSQLFEPRGCRDTQDVCGSDAACGWACSGCCQADPSLGFLRLLTLAPPDVHVVVSSFDEDAADDAARLKGLADAALARLDAVAQAHWQGRLHFVSVPVWQAEGWLGSVFERAGWLWFAVDPSQRMRQLGMAYDIAREAPDLGAFAHEARYFAFEDARDAALAAEEDVTVVPVFDGESVQATTVDVAFPPAEEMARFDTMRFDAGMYCAGHLDESCGEWDYLSKLFVCERPLGDPAAYADTPCAPAVPGVDAVAETLGLCPDGTTTCRADAECGEGGACAGYVPPEDARPAVPAETRACECESPLGAVEARTHVCREDGSGFAPCACACDTEIGRWITTYGREGRWVTDVSGLLALVRGGGTIRLRFAFGNPYETVFRIRLSRRGDGGRPLGARFLWSGGGFGEGYNAAHAPVEVVAPEGTRRVQLVAFVTGHGFGVERANCAEFCNHTHHVRVNGVEFVKAHPEAGSADGCLLQVADGVVPNQYGTWPFGRGGWCPGLDVRPWVVDVTDALVSGPNTLEYEALYGGADYVPQPVTNPSGGFPANIDLTSYLVFLD